MSLTEFLRMGGYGGYVWSAYGIATVVLIWQLVAPIAHRRRILKEIKRRKRRESPRQ